MTATESSLRKFALPANRVEDMALVIAALENVQSMSPYVWHYFRPFCGYCFGTGAGDEGRRTQKYDGGCAACGGSGMIDSRDVIAAARRVSDWLHEGLSA